ncbi:MAG: ABC transporter ATP-binding protein [Christensenellaceae bacterium]|nr:ABC transporter ATP-binding protein [Christensenellaceae bacterium]MEA5067344.1 ABC transporter ATP-binding protein [Eubacteriales bacterium]MEA5069012.1 ABC transporter ATP-binding protein [Christensenellaceae bacterium]
MNKNLLAVDSLSVSFYTEAGRVSAVENVSFELKANETLGIVGESGCGKSVTSMSMLGLIPMPPGKIESGSAVFDGRDLIAMNAEQRRKVRGNEISMIFQEPMTSLNPVFTVGRQLGEVFTLHRGMDKKAAHAASVEQLRSVGIPNPERIAGDYPFALSGGMRQRVMIAMALACRPKLLIADEPTTALDVTIQAQILTLMKQMQAEYKTAIMFITHDLGVIAEMSDRVLVMYAGHVMEEAPVARLFRDPLHPYTQGLLMSKPQAMREQERLYVIPGIVPNLLDRPSGCQFHPRCPHKTDRCEREAPPLFVQPDGRKSRCWLSEAGAKGGAQ